jgi:hypothetical protein
VKIEKNWLYTYKTLLMIHRSSKPSRIEVTITATA